MSFPYEEISSEPWRDRARTVIARALARPARLLPVALLLVAVGGGAWVWPRRSPGDAFVTAPVVEGPIAARVTANGTIAARVTVQVGSQVSGRIQEIMVDFNFKVARGQILARLDGELFQAAVAQARANLEAARGTLAKANAQAANARKALVRARALAAKGLIAGADVDRAEADAAGAGGDTAAARGAVAQARAQLHQTQTNFNYTTIVSPVDGVVISRNVDVGQTVAASLQAPTLFTIAEDLRTMQVHTNVPEADVGKLQAGSKATFTVDAFSDQRWEGTVREIRNASQVTQNVVTYDAVVDVENLNGRLRPGMTATVSFEYATRARAALIPNAALRFKLRSESKADVPAETADGAPTGGAVAGAGAASKAKGSSGGGKAAKPAKPGARRAVYVLVGGEPERRMIKLGISDGKVTEIADGDVHAGDLVIVDDRGDDAKRADPARRDSTRRLPTRL